MKKILLIEDDQEISAMLQRILAQDYEIIPAYSGTEGLMQFNAQPFDLIILDIMLPGKTGAEVLGTIRETSPVPIIMLTALSDKKLVTDYLLKGADDYLTKPFDIAELKARIVVQLRQQSSQGANTPTKLSYKKLSLEEDLFQISAGGMTQQLSKKEFLILQLLISHPNKIYTKEELYERVWGEAYYGDENTVNVHISNLRKKIQLLDQTEAYIETVWSLGIKLAK